jgi:hypothetical protein
MPNTHQIIAAPIQPNIPSYRGSEPVATPILLTQPSSKTEKEIAEDMLAVLKDFRKAFNAAAIQADGAITTTVCNSRMKNSVVTGTASNPQHLFVILLEN